LGDLYQDLSEAAKKRYALLQTPDFVETFILDRTLEPALAEFGLAETRLIDPTCGSGHFLISAFERLFDRWTDAEPGTPSPVLAQRALDAVHGVDLNPFATAIARFRLVIAALRRCRIGRLSEAPAFTLHLATGDSLLHGRPQQGEFPELSGYREGIRHFYETEDAPELTRILGQGYHAVVGNPPYINVKDSALRGAYRARYDSCHGKYALSVPFMERFFDLARPEREGPRVTAGFVGQITANSFMKREFGAKLVEGFLPSVDLDTIIDTSGAYIPGHGTPTVIVFGRTRRPTRDTLRVVDAVRGEPSQPADPANGLVWSSIVAHVDQPGTEDRFVRVSDPSRAEFSVHPMTLGVGRGVRRALENGRGRLSRLKPSMGFVAIAGEDDAFTRPAGLWRGQPNVLGLITGDLVRDWAADPVESALFPYEGTGLVDEASLGRNLWPLRTSLWARPTFDRRTYRQAGRTWFEWHQTVLERLLTPLTITWGEVATHNHFALDRGGKVFKQTAPVIKLPESASEEDHLRLLGVLNSATACFWLKQVCHNKGSTVDNKGARQRSAPFEDFFALNATKVKELPLPADRSLDLPRRIDALATERAALLDMFAPGALGEQVRELARRDAELLGAMVSAQEELDWQVMGAYGLVGDEVTGEEVEAPPLALGERAFELVLARQVLAGEVETSWFVRHGSTPITEPPAHWPDDYRALVGRRTGLIAEDPDVGLIERPEHKRRWSGVDPFTERLHRRLVALVLDRLEAEDVWAGEPRLRSVSELADLVRRDAQLAEACSLIAGDRDAEVGAVVRGLVLDQAVSFLAAHRHTAAGLRKRAVWERTWDLQREEDAAERDGRSGPVNIPVPPRYGPTDFVGKVSWSLRGKLDVPKERFVLVPGAERGAAEVVAWAGWDEATRARALASRVLELQSEDAADSDRLAPILAGVLELLPWIHQWHPEPDPAFGQPLGPFFEDWLDGMLAQLGLTREALREWRPPAPTRGRRRKAT
ncbi:MAG: BREX-2 system adenine-specific DNA-methyltransferase PglX, partial [Solirubrobacteraceae bacterium]